MLSFPAPIMLMADVGGTVFSAASPHRKDGINDDGNIDCHTP
ncbi:hypothetical protein [Sphingobacterium allocomposti]|nr:hypothetical protein [Sphingobacterium composti Yoo et al. 2007 non Ten et al. 2007]